MNIGRLPCDECKGKCCTYPAMSKREFKRIKAVHGIPEGTKIIKFPAKWAATYSKNGKPAVRTSDSVVLSLDNGNCPYLTSEGKCGVYPLRPKVCRDYGVNPGLPCMYVDPVGAERATEKLMQFSRENL